MTRTALIKQILRLAGVPEIHARRFMESFLLRLAYLLQNGGSFLLPSLGSFELRFGRKPGAAKGEFTEVVLCHLASANGEALVFNVPAFVNRNRQPVDRYYSISIGKPIIPVKAEAVSPELLLLSGGDIASKALDERVTRLIGLGEVIRESAPGSRAILDLNPRLFGMESAATTDKHAPAGKNTRTDTIASEEHVGWSFGNDWETELEEDEIIASSAVPAKSAEPEEGEINWDFGFLDAPQEPARTPKRPVFTPPATPVTNSSPKESFSVPLPSEPVPSFIPGPGVTREYEIDLSEFDDNSAPQDDAGTEALEDFDSIFKKSLAENVLFAPKPKKDEPPPPPPPPAQQPHVAIPDTFEMPSEPEGGVETLEEEEEEIEGSMVGALDLRKTRVPGMEGEEGKRASRRKRTAAAPAPKKPASKWRYFWYSLSAVTILAMGAVIYVRTFGIPAWLPTTARMEEYIPRKFVPTIIERDYLIAVSYPYAGSANRNEFTDDMFLKGPDTANTGLPPAVAPVPGDKNNPADKNKPDTNPTIIGADSPQEPAPDPAADKKGKLYEGKLASNVKGNIYKEGTYYTVQLMASKDKKEAEDAVRLLIAKGINAFLRVADIPGKGIWYRVRAGQFATMPEAEEFSRKYSR